MNDNYQHIFKNVKNICRNICWLMVLTAALLFLGAQNSDARSVYVAERQEITLRSGPSTDHRVLQMLASGTRLTLLEGGDGWLRVQGPDGNSGWVLQRFTTEELPCSLQLARLQQEYDQLREASGGALDRIAELESTNVNLMDSLSEATNSLVALDQEYKTLAADAANVLELKERHDQAMRDLELAENTIRSLSGENEELRSSQRLHWFLSGAGVVFGSWLFGFVMGRHRRRPKSGLQF